MVLSKNLVCEACEITEDTLLLEEEETGESLDFVIFGAIEHQNHVYLYGMEGDDFDKTFGNHKQKEMPIMFLEIHEAENGEITYSTVPSFTNEDEKVICEEIQFNLNANLVANKYALN